jgi:hypothetical protein
MRWVNNDFSCTSGRSENEPASEDGAERPKSSLDIEHEFSLKRLKKKLLRLAGTKRSVSR